MMRNVGLTCSKLAVLLLLHAAGAGLASPHVLITRPPENTVEWLPRDNQTLFRLEPGKPKRLELNSSSINQATIFITVSPCLRDVHWAFFRGSLSGANGHISYMEEQRGVNFAIITAVVRSNERYVLQLKSSKSGAAAVSVTGEKPKFSRMRLKVRSKRRIAAIWDPSPIDPQCTSYCVVASTKKVYSSLCEAHYDIWNNPEGSNKILEQTNAAGRVKADENTTTCNTDLDSKIVINNDFDIYEESLKQIYRRKKFSRSTKVSDRDPVIACIGDRTRHFIGNINASSTYFVSVFAVAKDRRNGAFLASSTYHPKFADPKQLRDNITSRMEILSRQVFYYKATMGVGRGIWISAETNGGSVDIEVKVRERKLYAAKHIQARQHFFVPAPWMTSSMQETSDEGSMQFESNSSEEARLRYVILVTPSKIDGHDSVAELEITVSSSRFGPGAPRLPDDGIVRELRPKRTCKSVEIAFLPALDNDTHRLRYCITAREKLGTFNFSRTTAHIRNGLSRQCFDNLHELGSPVIVQKVDNLRNGRKYEIQVTASNTKTTVPYKTLYVETHNLCR